MQTVLNLLSKITIVLGGIILAGAGLSVMLDDSKKPEWATKPTPPPPAPETASSFVRFSDDKYERSSIMLTLSGTLENVSTVSVKDVVFMCEIFAKSGTKLKTPVATLYDQVEPGKKLKFRGLKISIWPDQGESLRCYPIKVIAGGKAYIGE